MVILLKVKLPTSEIHEVVQTAIRLLDLSPKTVLAQSTADTCLAQEEGRDSGGPIALLF